MLILTPENTVVNTDTMRVGDEVHHSVLSFQDLQSPDYFFRVVEFLDEFTCAAITLKIGEYETVMPMHWSILCTDMEYLQSIPLWEVGGKNFPVFCLNPIDGYAPEFLRLRTSTIFPTTTWTAPQLHEKDLLTVPLGKPQSLDTPRTPAKAAMAGGGEVVTPLEPSEEPRREVVYPKGPLCATFSASKYEVYKPIADIW